MAQFQFIILGAGRGGTSLLTALLHQHPHIECGMELFAYDVLVQGQKQFWEKDNSQVRLQRFFKACERYAQQSPKDILGNKITTEQLRHATRVSQWNFEKLFTSFPPSLKIIFITRDARSHVPSKMKRGEKTLEEAISLWNYTAEMQFYLSIHYPNKTHTLAYEHLLEHTQASMEGICSFLDIPFHPSVLSLRSTEHLPEIYSDQKDIHSPKPIVEPQPEWLHQVKEQMQRLGYIN